MSSLAAAVMTLAAAIDISGVDLSWTAPSGCPSQAEVRAAVESLLGQAAPRGSVVASARVARTRRGYRAHLVVASDGQRSERTLTATHCAALADATALVIAVTIDPEHALGPDAPASTETPANEPEADGTAAAEIEREPVSPEIPEPSPSEPPPRLEPLPTSPPPPQPRAAHRVSRRRIDGGHVRAIGAAEVGPVAPIAGAVGVAIGLDGRWFRVETAASWTFARERAVPSFPAARASIALWTIAARGCGVPRWRWIELPVCGGVEAGALEAVGTGATVDARPSRRPFVALTLGPALAIVPIPRLAVLLGADLLVPLWRARFVIGDESVHRPAPVGFRASLGLEVRFGRSP